MNDGFFFEATPLAPLNQRGKICPDTLSGQMRGWSAIKSISRYIYNYGDFCY